MKVTIYLNGNLQRLIPLFTVIVTQPVKRGTYFFLYILITFFVGNLFWSCIMLLGSGCYESQYLSKSLFTELDSLFYRLGYPIYKKGSVPLS